jgi:alpha(1,3/1,4) fucosyltransferase
MQLEITLTRRDCRFKKWNKITVLQKNTVRGMNIEKPIRIWFTDFWGGFDNYNNYFTNLLKQHFNIVLDPDPDFLIHSVYDRNYLKYNCFRICFTGENTRPNYKLSDYHIGFDLVDHPNYLRWPLFLLYYNTEGMLHLKNTAAQLESKTGFCSFVVSNPNAKERIEFYKELSKYKKVDSGGKVHNNIGYFIDDKTEFIKSRKFCIAYENSSYPGYTTEKIWEPFLVKSIPIYWGNPKIELDFNPKSFINAHQFNSNHELIKFIAEVDNNHTLYKSMVEEPCFMDNVLPTQWNTDKLIAFFDSIFQQKGKFKPVASYWNNINYLNYCVRKRVFNWKKQIFK